jgi:hypothetical protein
MVSCSAEGGGGETMGEREPVDAGLKGPSQAQGASRDPIGHVTRVANMGWDSEPRTTAGRVRDVSCRGVFGKAGARPTERDA